MVGALDGDEARARNWAASTRPSVKGTAASRVLWPTKVGTLTRPSRSRTSIVANTRISASAFLGEVVTR